MTALEAVRSWGATEHAPLYATGPSWSDTDGDLARRLAVDLGWELDEVQGWVVDQALAVGEDGMPACSEVAIVGPRQTVGKSVSLEVLALWDVFVAEVELHVWTAHVYSTARKSYEDMKRRIERSRDYAARCKFRETNGEQSIIVDNGCRIEFHARTGGKGGRGFPGVRRITLDEWLYGRPGDLGALAPTMVTQPDAQVRYASSAGMVGSAALREIRKRGRSGDDPGLAYIELGAERRPCGAGLSCRHRKDDPTCALNDRALWWQSNSGLWRTGSGKVGEPAVAKQRRMLDAAEFAREFLSWWEDPPNEDGGAFDVQSFGELAVPAEARDERGRPVAFGVAVAPDRSWSAVAVAWSDRATGTVHTRSIDYRPHATWLPDRVTKLRRMWGGPVVVDSRSRDLIDGAIEPSEQDQAVAEAALFDAVTARTLRHGGESELLTAVSAAGWQQSGAHRRLVSSGSIDIGPLRAAALAVHAASGAVDPLSQVW